MVITLNYHVLRYFCIRNFKHIQEIYVVMWKYININEYAHDCKYERRNHHERTSTR